MSVTPTIEDDLVTLTEKLDMVVERLRVLGESRHNTKRPHWLWFAPLPIASVLCAGLWALRTFASFPEAPHSFLADPGRLVELALLVTFAYGIVVAAQSRRREFRAHSDIQGDIEGCKQFVASHLDSVRRRIRVFEESAVNNVQRNNTEDASIASSKESLTKVDCSVPFPEDKSYPVEHMRLNNFRGIATVDFTTNVLSHLDKYQQHVYARFTEQFLRAMDSLDLDRSQFFQVPDEFTRLRFLQSDGYDIDLAMKRLLACVQWRSSFGLDRFIESPDMKLIRRYRRIRVRRLVGMDRNGSPFVVERLGEFIASEESFRGKMTLDQWIMCYAYDASELMAAFRECSEKTGMYCHRMNYIGDLSGAKISGAFRLIPVLKVMTKAVESNFPEIAGNLIFINAPSFAASIWSIVKRIIDPRTASRITILSGPSSDVLRELCGSVVLPVEFGGTNPYLVPHPLQKLTPAFEDDFPLH